MGEWSPGGGGGGGGGAPSGNAGGDLSGSTYPNPIVKQGVYWFNVMNPPYNAKGDGSTDDAAAIQAALNDAFAVSAKGPANVWLPTPPTRYNFGTQLTIKSGCALTGPGFQGQGPILYWTGADATHAIIADASNNSKIRVAGFQLQDGRSSPTSGDGIHLVTTNGTIVEDIGCTGGFPNGSAVYLGRSNADTDNFTARRLWVAALSGYGLTLDHAVQNVLVEDIKGDAVNGGILALIRVLGSGSGQSTIQIRGAKCEATSRTSVQADLVYIDSSFAGRLDCTGLYLAGVVGTNTVGYVINNQATNVHISSRGWGTNQGVLGYLNDGPTSRVFGANSTAGRFPDLIFTSAGAPPASLTLGVSMDDVRTLSGVGATLDGSYSTLLVSTGASNQTINLPTASASSGFRYRIKKTDSGVGNVVITPHSGDLVDGAATYSLTSQYAAVEIICDGSGWNIVSKV